MGKNIALIPEGLLSLQPVSADIQAEGIGSLDHLVKVEATPSGQVLGLVVYFGFLAFTVHLGSASKTALAPRSYRVDQLGRSDRIDHPADLLLPIPSYDEAAAREIQEVLDLVVDQSSRLMRVVTACQERLWVERLIREHGQKMKTDLGDRTEATKEELSAFARDLAQDVIKQMMPRIKAASEKRQAAAAAEFEERVRLAKGNKDPE